MPKITVETEIDGKIYSLETGRLAKFASSVMIRCADTMVLVTAVAATKAKADCDYMPLQVEYREKSSAAGKFPGGFLRREGRPSDHEVICARLIDRPIRPLFPKTWRYETQVVANVFSFDPEVDPDTLSQVAASAALMISDIPFAGPVSEVRVGRIDGQFVLNPSHDLLEQSDIDMTVAGSDTSIVMVEGESQEISEEVFLEILEFAHERIRLLNSLQRQLVAQVNVQKREFIEPEIPEEVLNCVKNTVNTELIEFVHKITTKSERADSRNNLFEAALAKVTELFSEKEEYLNTDLSKLVEEILGKLEKAEMRKMILEDGRRLDGRSTTDIRPISCEIGILPRVHGSALFTRGETQSIGQVTLGTKHDEQMIDGLLPTYTTKFLLHYNFPPFCTGETGRLGTGRREIGHGHLAERALKIMLPNTDNFPYTIRVVSDILESNGSSSMATVCSGSLALFQAGVPMKKAVAGIAMGLIKEDEQVAILSDILGDEDHLGDMDFKVAGTVDGITACQMDIKIEGLPIEIMRKALEQARNGRMHILSIMNETISEPKEDISPYSPRFTKIMIPPDMIGAVIGSGGETIRGIVKDSGAEIDIDDDGTVTIAATSQESSQAAQKLIEMVIRKPEEGEIYNATVKEVREGLGAIMEFLPKKQGLLHISQIAHERTENVSDFLKAGDKIEVKLLEITPDGKFRLSRKALIPRPDGMEPEPEHRRSDSRPPQSGRRDDRRGNSGDRRSGGNDRRR